jgi:hypothetical protein
MAYADKYIVQTEELVGIANQIRTELNKNITDEEQKLNQDNCPITLEDMVSKEPETESEERVIGKIEQVFNSGYEQGKAEGGDNPLYYATIFNNVFGGAEFPENYDFVLKVKKVPALSNSTCSWMFNNAWNLKSITMIVDEETTLAINLESAFAISSAANKTLQLIDLSRFNRRFKGSMNNFCRYQKRLISILGALDFSKVTNTTNAFQDCLALTDIEFAEGTIPVSISFANSPLLSEASVQSIIDGLMTITDGVARTITFHQGVRNNLTSEQENEIVNVRKWTLLPADKTTS